MEGDGVRLHTSCISMGDVTCSGDYKNFMLFLKNEKKNRKLRVGCLTNMHNIHQWLKVQGRLSTLKFYSKTERKRKIQA